jgi:hypothetical protein
MGAQHPFRRRGGVHAVDSTHLGIENLELRIKNLELGIKNSCPHPHASEY